MKKYLASLPQIDRLLNSDALKSLLNQGLVTRTCLVKAARTVLKKIREQIFLNNKNYMVPSFEEILINIEKEAFLMSQAGLKPLINATGVILHTNLGRAPLSIKALEAINHCSASYSNLEFDIDSGTRGSRNKHIVEIIKDLTGAQAALVTNNNAAALLLALTVLAKDMDVLVSRGELVEIGGSFRVPELLSLSGCYLKEVGTTNKTRISDYSQNTNANTAVYLKVKPSNFKISGFTSSVEISELVALAKQNNVICIYDQGSGLMLPSWEFDIKGLEDELSVPELVSAGVDLLAFSGDKLLGGPQAGILVGRSDIIERLENHQLYRALRPDKTTLAALAATLKLYEESTLAKSEIPILKYLNRKKPELQNYAEQIKNKLLEVLNEDFCVDIYDDFSTPGGGCLAELYLPTTLVSISSKNPNKIIELEKNLRNAKPYPVISRLKNACLLLDPRTLSLTDLDNLVQAFIYAMEQK